MKAFKFCVFALVLFLVACTSPTPTPNPTALPPPIPTVGAASTTTVPVFCARYVGEDDKYPDDTKVKPGEQFKKIWVLENCGNTWAGLKVVRTKGTFGPESFDAPATMPNQNGRIEAEFTAPTTPGMYQSWYALQGPNGPFQDGFWVMFIVVE